ncbi:hypothetical protein Q8A73_023235 [Channa argus]|nr:hypothetical protein Q8A73_023235 [Channa argus]
MAAQFRQSVSHSITQQVTSSRCSLKQDSEKTETKIQQMIQEREQKMEEIKQSVELSKNNAHREIACGVQVFTALKESVERGQAEFIKTIEKKQKSTETQAEDFIEKLEQEISDLKKTSSEVEKLPHSKDHLHCLQNFSANISSLAKNWTKVSVHPSSYQGTLVRTVKQLESTLSAEMKRLFEAELRRVQNYAVNVILDPDVLHPKSIPSNNRQRVNDKCKCVLSKQGLSSGRFYFQVKVNRWSTWTLGVARNGTNLNSQLTLSPRNGYWTVCWKRKCFAAADPSVCLALKSKPEKVGVFVNYEEGLVSFYDADTADLIFSFTACCFTEKVYPFFSPCNNDGVKIHTTDEGCVLQ